MTAGSRWYVVQTHPLAETKAYSHLTRQGFHAYVPRFLKRRRHARRIETVPAPLFPCYLFVAIDVTTQRWRSVHSTIGVSKLVCDGERPVAVAPGIVEQLQSRHDERGYIKLDVKPQFAPGQRVKVLDGLFSAALGSFEGIADHERVAILLDLLGRKVRLVVDSESLAPA
ncbi:MAG: transcriptional activator RfaH [Pseudolabrys sp.]